MADTFDRADYFEICPDAESFEHETAEDAICGWFENWAIGTDKLLAGIAKECPVTVRAYVAKGVPDSFAKMVAEWVLDDIGERFSDDYGNCMDPEPLDVPQELGERFESIIREIIAKQPVWQCDEVSSRAYNAAEVEQVLRAKRPGWFLPLAQVPAPEAPAPKETPT